MGGASWGSRTASPWRAGFGGAGGGGGGGAGRESPHMGRRLLFFGRALFPFQLGQPVDIAADAETAIAGKLPFAVEDRQPRPLDGPALGRVIDRPEHDDAAPG